MKKKKKKKTLTPQTYATAIYSIIFILYKTHEILKLYIYTQKRMYTQIVCVYMWERKRGIRAEEMVEEGPEWKENGESKGKVYYGEKKNIKRDI